MRAIASGLSDVGLQREHNEDSFVVLTEYDLFIVADGMGGHQGGEVASRLASQQLHVADLALRRPSLDDVFLSLTGQQTPSAAFDEVAGRTA